MQALWLFGWLFAKMFAWEGFGAEQQDAAYVLADDGLVEAQDGNTGGGPP
jgi:hypothetical protein